MTLTAHLLHLIKVPTITFMIGFGFPLSMLFHEVGYLHVFLPAYLLVLGTIAVNQKPPVVKPTAKPVAAEPITGASFIGLKRPTAERLVLFDGLRKKMKEYQTDADKLQKSEDCLIGKYSAVRNMPRPVEPDVNSIGEVSESKQNYLESKDLETYLTAAIKQEKVEPSKYSPAHQSVSEYVREVKLGTPGFPLPDNVEPLEPRTD